MSVGKNTPERVIKDESKEIIEGRLKEENPLDSSELFRSFCEACRRGDLKTCQESIQQGVNINARDEYDYTPLILVRYIQSLAGITISLYSPEGKLMRTL